MQTILKAVIGALPLIFGLGFLAPVIAQGLAHMGQPAPFGMPALTLGLLIGGVWGGFATWKGRWI